MQAMVDACQRVTIQDEKVKVSAYENQEFVAAELHCCSLPS